MIVGFDESARILQSMIEQGIGPADVDVYAAESYDATIIIALAAAVAGSDEPSAVAAEINDITRTGGTDCTEVAECLDLIEQGEDITYNGVLGVLSFQDAGEPGAGTYDIWEVRSDGSIETVESVEISL